MIFDGVIFDQSGGNKNPATNSVLCQVFKVSHTTWGYSPKIRWCHTSGRFLLLDYPFFCCKQQSKAPFGEKPVKGLQQPPPEHVCSGLGQRRESSCFNWSWSTLGFYHMSFSFSVRTTNTVLFSNSRGWTGLVGRQGLWATKSEEWPDSRGRCSIAKACSA